MSTLNKSRKIRAIVICLFRRDDRILVWEFDGANGDRFCRPPGGGIEFGEPSGEALVREIREEIGAEIDDPELIGVFENIWTYEVEHGHEVVFVYDAQFRDRSLYEKTEIPIYESEIDLRSSGRWDSLEELAANGIRLVPERLADLVSGVTAKTPQNR